MPSSRRYPPRLQRGARVGLIAPSGPLDPAVDVETAAANARTFGWEPVIGEHVRERDGYLAGSDDHRLADLNRFANDDSIDGIWCIRGGYGATRLLDGIDFDAWSRKPRALIGYSDITALHASIGQRADIVSYHGPTARAQLTDMTRASFGEVMAMERGDSYAVQGCTTVVGGRARGRLVGGNLALVTAMVGTPYAWDMDDAILVLEDVSETVYRIDRMLTQLRSNGAFARLKAIAFGGFTEIPEDPNNADRPVDRVLREFAEAAKLPCVMNFPIGHVPDHVTLPLGAVAELNADDGVLSFECN